MKITRDGIGALPPGTLVWMSYSPTRRSDRTHLLLRRAEADRVERLWITNPESPPGSLTSLKYSRLVDAEYDAKFEVVSQDEVDRRMAIYALAPELLESLI